MQIQITVEMEPHTEDLTGTMLNRPAPQGGAFLVSQYIDNALQHQMKQVGAWYWSADELEDFDMFNSLPGWRYSLTAIEVLLQAGHELEIRGEIVTTVEQLRAMFTNEAKVAYRERIEAELRREEQEREAAAQPEQARASAAGSAYNAWKTEHLAGLVKTFATTAYREREWGDVVLRESADTPGTWYTTGDIWHLSIIDGQPVYTCSYGNAVAVYAPQPLVDAWVEQEWEQMVTKYGKVKAAREVLSFAGHECIGSDVADRLIELHGAQYYIELATAEPWDLDLTKEHDWGAQAVKRFGIKL
jgi:hypothetical protein